MKKYSNKGEIRYGGTVLRRNKELCSNVLTIDSLDVELNWRSYNLIFKQFLENLLTFLILVICPVYFLNLTEIRIQNLKTHFQHHVKNKSGLPIQGWIIGLFIYCRYYSKRKT